jgi:L-amino acid N-acyltransferase YncA
VFIVKDNGECVGWAVIKERKSSRNTNFKFEFMVYIRRKYRRKGIGTKLYKRAKKFFKLKDKEIKVYMTTNYNSEFFDKVRKV